MALYHRATTKPNIGARFKQYMECTSVFQNQSIFDVSWWLCCTNNYSPRSTVVSWRSRKCNKNYIFQWRTTHTRIQHHCNLSVLTGLSGSSSLYETFSQPVDIDKLVKNSSYKNVTVYCEVVNSAGTSVISRDIVTASRFDDNLTECILFIGIIL